MKFFIKYSMNKACKVIVKDHLDGMSLNYKLKELNEIEITEPLTSEQLDLLNDSLKRYEIELVSDEQNMLVHRIKDIIREVVYSDNALASVNISKYLSDKLHYSYGHLSSVFSEVTATSIAHFTMMQKVERIKELLINTNLTLTEISYQMNYSSPAHLSNQFKKVTGLTPKRFKEIIEKKRTSSRS